MTPGKTKNGIRRTLGDLRTGQGHYRVWACKTNGLFRALLEMVETAYTARR